MPARRPSGKSRAKAAAVNAGAEAESETEAESESWLDKVDGVGQADAESEAPSPAAFCAPGAEPAAKLWSFSPATVAENFERIVEVGGVIAQTSTIRWNFSAAAAPNIANHIPILKPCIVAFECGAARLNLLHGYHVMAAGAQTASGPSNGH